MIIPACRKQKEKCSSRFRHKHSGKRIGSVWPLSGLLITCQVINAFLRSENDIKGTQPPNPKNPGRGLIVKDPRSVAVNHAGLWIRRHQFESGRGYPHLCKRRIHFYIRACIPPCVINTISFCLCLYLSILIVVVIAGIAGMMAFENRTPLDASYFVVVTISTVALGIFTRSLRRANCSQLLHPRRGRLFC